MAKLLFTENGEQMWRNFAWVRIIRPDGQLSKPRRFQGTIVLSTGKEPEDSRVLELLCPGLEEVSKGTFRYLWGFALGMLFWGILSALI